MIEQDYRVVQGANQEDSEKWRLAFSQYERLTKSGSMRDLIEDIKKEIEVRPCEDAEGWFYTFVPGEKIVHVGWRRGDSISTQNVVRFFDSPDRLTIDTQNSMVSDAAFGEESLYGFKDLKWEITKGKKIKKS